MRLNHPPGFYVVWFAEMMERFGYYLFRSLFVLYAQARFGVPESTAIRWLASFQIVGYFAPAFGGAAADRFVGTLRAVVVGAIVLALGHFALGFETKTSLVLGCGLLALGGGLFKPNMQTTLSNLYAPGDPRHDSAFSLFYLAINIGAFAAPLVGWAVQARYGYGAAFAVGGVGHVLGQAVLLACKRHLTNVRAVFEFAAVPTEGGVGGRALPTDRRDTIRRVAVVVATSLVMSLFWAVFLADGGVITFWAKECVTGFKTRSSLTNMVNPLCIVVFTPLVIWGLKQYLRRNGRELGAPAKLLTGFLLAAGAAALLAAGAAGNAKGVSLWWLVGYYALITFGELFVNPLGTALVARVAPSNLRGVLLGCWIGSSALGSVVLWLTSDLWGVWSHTGYFRLLTGLSLGGVALTLAMSPWLSSVLQAVSAPLGTGLAEPAPPAMRKRPVLQLIRDWRKAA